MNDSNNSDNSDNLDGVLDADMVALLADASTWVEPPPGLSDRVVAAVRSGHADTLCDEQGRDLLPSVVHYQSEAIRVGIDAKLRVDR